MKIDLYTKTILTIIAFCLLSLTWDTILSSKPVRADTIMSVNIEQINGRSIHGDAIPVKAR